MSSLHAAFRFGQSQWELKDLGSRNGTWLNGEKLTTGNAHTLTCGSKLAFGNEQELWSFVDDSPPRPMVVPEDGGQAVILEQDLVGLPNDDEPEVILMRDGNGLWRAERMDGESIALANRGTFEVSGKSWRFAFAESVGATSVISDHKQLAPITLSFFVSSDEEHVELRAECDGRTIDLGARGHNYLLLTLARIRINDSKSGVRRSATGWTYVEDLEKALKTSAARLNIDIFRIRQHFSRLGLGKTVNIIERRHRAKQLRIGTGALVVKEL